MSQSTDVTLAPAISGLTQRTELNDILEAILSNHSGSSRPSYILANQMWVDDSASPSVVLKFFDGDDDITMGTFNIAANTFTPSGSATVAFANNVTDKTSTHTLDGSHAGRMIFFDATAASFTSNLTAAATLGLGWYFVATKSDSSSNTITIDPVSAELINGDTTLVLRRQYDSAIVVCTGSAFRAIVITDNGTQKVSSDDTTPGYLEDKLTAGDGIALTTATPAGNETRSVAVNLDTTPGLEFSGGKLKAKAGTGILVDGTGISADYGTSANKLVRLDASGKLPAVDGSQLINLPGGGGGGGGGTGTAATQAEMEAASSTTVFTTPGRQHFHPSAAKFWAYLPSGTLAASYNVSSIGSDEDSNPCVNIAVDFSSANWCPCITMMGGVNTARYSIMNQRAGNIAWVVYSTTGSSLGFKGSIAGFGDQ